MKIGLNFIEICCRSFNYQYTNNGSGNGSRSTWCPAALRWTKLGDITSQWRLNERHCVSNHRRLGCLLNRLFRRTSKKTSKLCVAGLCEGNPPVTGGFPSQRASNAENVSIWWCHHKKNVANTRDEYTEINLQHIRSSVLGASINHHCFIKLRRKNKWGGSNGNKYPLMPFRDAHIKMYPYSCGCTCILYKILICIFSSLPE